MALRPSAPGDREAVLEVLAARDLVDFGVGDLTRGLVLDQWRRGDFDPSTDAVVATSGGALAGYAAVFGPGALAFVAPARERLGVGAELLSWSERRTRELGRHCHRQRVAAGNLPAQTLLSAAGYGRARSVQYMEHGLDELYPPRIPDGITFAPVEVDRDAAALHAADRSAFALVSEYEPSPLAAFYEEHLASPELAPEFSPVARRGETVVGFALCRRWHDGVGFVDLLAVDPAERRRGLGSALLLTALHAFARAGCGVARLEVASDNPHALALYARMGMSRRHQVDIVEKPLA